MRNWEGLIPKGKAGDASVAGSRKEPLPFHSCSRFSAVSRLAAHNYERKKKKAQARARPLSHQEKGEG